MKLIAVDYSTGEILTDMTIVRPEQGATPPAIDEVLWLNAGTFKVRSVSVQNFAGGQLATCIVDSDEAESASRKQGGPQ